MEKREAQDGAHVVAAEAQGEGGNAHMLQRLPGLILSAAKGARAYAYARVYVWI